MPSTRKQKKARKSRGLEILSDMENLDIMLGEMHSEREVSANSNSARRPESVTSDMFENNGETLYLNNVEARDLVLVPVRIRIQPVLTPTPRSTNCRVNLPQGCLGK